MSVQGRLPTATTRIAAVIGDPISHSLSPTLFNAAFQDQGVDWVFGAFTVPEGATRGAVAAMRELKLSGLSVTMPHKSAVIAHLDALSPSAQRLGAANCVAWESSRLVGHSTDGDGLVDALRLDEGFEPESARCLVIGAGGAARAAVAALAGAGAAEVIVVNRTPSRAEAAARLAGTRGRVGATTDIAQVDLIVNATPVGMAGGAVSAMPVDPESLHPGQVYFDMVYHPSVTPAVAAARTRGVHAAGGLGMLVHQAAHAYRLWLGHDAPTPVMAAAAAAELERRYGIADP